MTDRAPHHVDAGGCRLGRRTWQDFLSAWGGRADGNPYTARMNSVTKYVPSTTLDTAAAWPNSVLLRGEATRTVAELKAADGTGTVTTPKGVIVARYDRS